MKMDILPVEIKIKDNWKFCEVAFLVDRDDFLRDVIKTRKKLKLSKLVPYEKLFAWEDMELQRTSVGKTKKVKHSYGDGNWEIYLVPHTPSEIIVEELRKKYRKGQNFWLAIQSAMLTGVVTENEFSNSAYCKVIYPDDYKYSLKEPEIAIIISPETKLKEIKEQFTKSIPAAIAEYKEIVLKTKRRLPDTISNIKRDREWHWQKKDGLSYGKINEQAKLNGVSITRDGVIQAIKQYRQRLSVEL